MDKIFYVEGRARMAALALASGKDLKARLEDAHSALAAIQPSDFAERHMRERFTQIFDRFSSVQDREGHYLEDTLASMSPADAEGLAEDVIEFGLELTQKVARLDR